MQMTEDTRESIESNITICDGSSFTLFCKHRHMTDQETCIPFDPIGHFCDDASFLGLMPTCRRILRYRQTQKTAYGLIFSDTSLPGQYCRSGKIAPSHFFVSLYADAQIGC